MAYKFEQEGVLSEGADAARKAQDEHDPTDDDEEPHWVEASQVCDGWQVGQDALGGGGGETAGEFKPSISAFCERQQSAPAALQIWLALNS